MNNKWPNHTDNTGPVQKLFSSTNKNIGVTAIQKKSKELTKLKYVFVLLTVYFVNG